MVSEIASLRLRARTQGLANIVLAVVQWLIGFIFPYMFNPDKANMGGKEGFIFGGLSFPCILFLWFYQPETRGRTYEELDEMFMAEVPARQFKKYQTEAESRGREAAGTEKVSV